MVADLSMRHEPIGTLLDAARGEDLRKYRLSQEQLDFFDEHGYLSGVRILSDRQVDNLRDELQDLVAAEGPAKQLFYEYNSNESVDPSRVLFHALGAWRIAPDFTIFSGIRPLPCRPANSWVAPSDSGTISCFASPPDTAAWSPGIRITPTGRAPVRWRI